MVERGECRFWPRTGLAFSARYFRYFRSWRQSGDGIIGVRRSYVHEENAPARQQDQDRPHWPLGGWYPPRRIGRWRLRYHCLWSNLARLGGYLARASDPPPGNMVIWRGLSRLADIQLGAAIAAESCG